MTASISGQVRNSSGKFVSGVIVRALHEPTGSTFAKMTDSDGLYRFDRIKVGGPYALSASGDGFDAISRKGIHVRTEEAHIEDFDLHITDSL